ncbi:MAG: hypothetical protein MUP82_10370 [Candidatus Marinimicrobia bacterium]|nr:hypothetical protein [Candidatus Neomarinimicrobiota bacterium]
MRDLSAQIGIGSDANFLNGNLVDDQTEINEGVNQDLVQFFQKIASLASISPNGDPDNETNGYQLLIAIEFVVRSYFASTTQKGTVEKATTAEMEGGTVDKFIDAELLQALTATTTRKGIVEKATPTEVANGVADKFIDAALLQASPQFQSKEDVIIIGAWNMVTTLGLSVPWTLPADHYIVSMQAIIRSDVNSGDAFRLDFADLGGASTDPISMGSIQEYNSSTNSFNLRRTPSGVFDAVVFSSILISRGNIHVTYRHV